MRNKKFVNITVVTFNRLDYTKQCIESVLDTADYPYVLTLVDNGSTDGTVAWLKEQKEKHRIKNLILHSVNKGVAVAANDGWEAEDCYYYMKLDNDVVMQKKSWLGSMVQVADHCTNVGAVAYNLEPVSYPLVQIDGFQLRVKNGNLGGGCILIPKRIHWKLGFWCEEYGSYGEEDTDYGVRILLAGYLNCYMEDETVALHLPDGLDTGYRRFKDTERERNWSEQGAFTRNIIGYIQGARSLYVARLSR